MQFAARAEGGRVLHHAAQHSPDLLAKAYQTGAGLPRKVAIIHGRLQPMLSLELFRVGIAKFRDEVFLVSSLPPGLGDLSSDGSCGSAELVRKGVLLLRRETLGLEEDLARELPLLSIDDEIPEAPRVRKVCCAHAFPDTVLRSVLSPWVLVADH